MDRVWELPWRAYVPEPPHFVSATNRPARPEETIVLLVAERAAYESIRRDLRDAPVVVYYCGDPELAAQSVERVGPTVLLYRAAENESFAFVRRFRGNDGTRDLPNVVLSARGDRTDVATAFAAGASDYLTYGSGPGELLARLRYHSEAYVQKRTFAEAHRIVRESKASLLKKIGELELLGSVDALTGLSNRRYFDDFTAMQWKLAIREGHPFSILMIDVDDFKKYNDTYGHLAGDIVLKRLGEALRLCCKRPVDLIARFGGEEFVVSLRAPFEGASVVAERLCSMVEDLDIPHRSSSVAGRVTISIGGASALPVQGEAYLPLVEAAHVALYEAKSGGKNRAVFRAGEGAYASRSL